jgi:hypothetical protein
MPRSWLIALLAPFALAGCLSFSSSDPRPPDHTTVVVPQQPAETPPQPPSD